MNLRTIRMREVRVGDKIRDTVNSENGGWAPVFMQKTVGGTTTLYTESFQVEKRADEATTVVREVA